MNIPDSIQNRSGVEQYKKKENENKKTTFFEK